MSSIWSFRGNNKNQSPYSIRIALLTTRAGSKLINISSELHTSSDMLKQFWSPPSISSNYNFPIQYTGVHTSEDGDAVWYWNFPDEIAKRCYSLLSPAVYSILTELEQNGIPFKFIEIEQNTGSLYMRGNYPDKEHLLALKISISPYEKIPVST